MFVLIGTRRHCYSILLRFFSVLFFLIHSSFFSCSLSLFFVNVLIVKGKVWLLTFCLSDGLSSVHSRFNSSCFSSHSTSGYVSSSLSFALPIRTYPLSDYSYIPHTIYIVGDSPLPTGLALDPQSGVVSGTLKEVCHKL